MLNSAVVSAWLWVHVGVLLIVVAYATCGSALLGPVADRGRERLGRAPLRTLLVGLGLSVPWMVAAITLMSLPNGILKLVGASLTVAWVATSLLGMSSLAMHVGARGDAGAARWTTVARGGALISLTWMLPIVGWFVAMPLSLACGAGCLVLSLRRESSLALA
ncbi:MAG: hypothetical protein U0572_03325 [Phycisphaerales bacterium]